jgi:uncharacterized protein with FMN-binding domain
MSRSQFRLPSDPGRTVRKLFLSVFVVFTFAAYVINERLTKPDSASYAANGPAASAPASSVFGVPLPADSALPTQSSGGTAATSSGYKNGTFQGPAVDAYYGLVQVQVSIQSGSIQSVQFLQYPSDRRTSQQINSIAMPYLQQEAIQAQSANVDIISGATLTSQGFEMSLQSALQSAHN